MPVPTQGPQREFKSLLICPDRSKAAELLRLLAASAPGVIPQHAYPSSASLIGLLHTPGLRLCFVDAETEPEAALRLIAQIAERAPAIAIVVVLNDNNPDLILRCLRQGAAEFLIRPFSPDQLEAVWERLARVCPLDQAVSENLGRLFVVIPGKGASGATSVAANLAFQMKRSGKQKVLLADLDPLTGTVAFLLKLKSGYSFLEALAHADRMDADLWKAIVSPCQEVDVLLSPGDPVGAGEDWDPTALLAFCRRSYDLTVVDAGGAFGEWNLSLAKLADELLLVTTNELPALHATQRALGYLEGNGLTRSRLRILVNRYPGECGLVAENIQTALETPVFQTLPSDYETLQKALMDGKPVSPGSRFGKSIAELAQRLSGEQQGSRNGSLLSLLFRKR